MVINTSTHNCSSSRGGWGVYYVHTTIYFPTSVCVVYVPSNVCLLSSPFACFCAAIMVSSSGNHRACEEDTVLV